MSFEASEVAEEDGDFSPLESEISPHAGAVSSPNGLEGDISPLEVEEGESNVLGMFADGCVVSDHFGAPESNETLTAIENSEEKLNVSTAGKSSEMSTPKRQATIMVAGRPRNGKSTALNNIFGLNLVAKTAATSVTQVVSVTEVTKKVRKLDKDKELQEDEITLRVIDTPGLGATDIKKEDILTEMKKITQSTDYTLMYCFSVSPNQIILEIDKAIVENLSQSLGKDVWNKCVLLLTFSDHAYLEFEDSKEEYIEHIKNHAIQFENLLKSVVSDAPKVKTIFEYESPEKLEQEENPSEIVAIPVNKKPQNSKTVLPGMLKKGQDWTDVVFIELMKKTGEEERMPFLYFRYPNLGAVGAGAAVGAGVGAMMGALGGPIGIAAGTALGAVVGGASGGAAGFAIDGMVKLINWITQNSS